MEEYLIYSNPNNNLTDRITARALGTGIFVLSGLKSVFQLTKENGMKEIRYWYEKSNAGGVNNTPDTHKH